MRAEVLRIDEHSCMDCGLSPSEGKTMHVHHREYRPGLLPWEYPIDLLETLCAGCHAREHGIIAPADGGWLLLWMNDEGELSENCRSPMSPPKHVCHEPIRYVFTVWHAQWGFVDVGTVCCDRMTGTSEATELAKARTLEKREKFIRSERWRERGKSTRIKRNGIEVYVFPWSGRYRIRMRRGQETVLGRRLFDTQRAARSAAFDAIESGAADRLLLVDDS